MHHTKVHTARAHNSVKEIATKNRISGFVIRRKFSQGSLNNKVRIRFSDFIIRL